MKVDLLVVAMETIAMVINCVLLFMNPIKI
jgi:hypothetical protein